MLRDSRYVDIVRALSEQRLDSAVFERVACAAAIGQAVAAEFLYKHGE